MREKTTERPCGLLFDLDGVLLDSEGLYTIFWKQMDELYPTGIDNFDSYIKGFHLSRILTYFDSDEIRQQILQRLNDYEKNMRFEFFAGALDLVKQLRQAGIPMAIVTSSDRKKMQALYEQHPEFPTLFNHIITGDMVTKAKPDPDCYLMGAELLGLNIMDCIVMEDSRNGLLAGRASGARVIGIATTLTASAVSQLSDMTVDDVSQLSVDRILNCPRRR